ncbi:hypothetical protein BDC45DRAFT_541909 [Circinella umbellata]|nr:hypothetical protein BDC45DRAFT_541909 [Circinella umbellata]
MITKFYHSLMCLDQENSCFHPFEKQLYEIVTKQHKTKQGCKLLPSLARKWCSKFYEVISSSKFQKSNSSRMTRAFANEAGDLHENNHQDNEADDGDYEEQDEQDILQPFAGLILHAVPVFDTWSDNWVLENTFKQQHITLQQSIFEMANDTYHIPQLYEHFAQIKSLLLPTIQKINQISTLTHIIYQVWKDRTGWFQLLDQVKPTSNRLGSSLTTLLVYPFIETTRPLPFTLEKQRKEKILRRNDADIPSNE